MFEIGERVTSPFTGTGTVIGVLVVDIDIDNNRKIHQQRVQFDNPILGERLYPINKLQTLEGEVNAKVDLQKVGGDGS